MTNDLKEAEEVLNGTDYIMLNILGISRTVKKGWREFLSTFGGVGLLSFAME